MTHLSILLLSILFFITCGKNNSNNPALPDGNILKAERDKADLDDDDIPDLLEMDKTRLIIQVPKLKLSSNTLVDLTFFFRNGQAEVQEQAVWSFFEAPIVLLDIMAKKMGERDEVNGEFFQKMAEMENCWVLKDLFHPINLPQTSNLLLRLSLKIRPEILLEGVPKIEHLSDVKFKAFSLGEDGDIAYLAPKPRWLNEFGEEVEISSLINLKGKKMGSIALDFDHGHGLDFLLGRKRQLGLCIEDFSYQMNEKKRILSHVIKKAKLNGVALNFTNGLKFSKVYYVKNINLLKLFNLIGKEYELTNDGRFILDSRTHTPFEVNDREYLMEEDLQNGPWISASELSPENVLGQSSAEQLQDFLLTEFEPKLELGLFAIPIYKILNGVYGNSGFLVRSDNHTEMNNLQLPKIAPGREVDLILSAQENVPNVSEIKIISVEACVKISDIGRNKSQDCGDGYRGWCGIYHRDLTYVSMAKFLTVDMIKGMTVVIGAQSFPLKFFLDERFTLADDQGRLHLRFKSPLILSSMKWILPKLGEDYQRSYGFEGFEKCQHRNLGRDFRFLNYPGRVSGLQKSLITWQLQGG